MENKPASLLIVPLIRSLKGIPRFLAGELATGGLPLVYISRYSGRFLFNHLDMFLNMRGHFWSSDVETAAVLAYTFKKLN